MTIQKGQMQTAEGDILYPQTSADVVFDEKGKRVSTRLEEVDNSIASLKDSVSNGKIRIATAITDKGVPTSSDSNWMTMEDHIRRIEGPSLTPTAISFTIGGNSGAMFTNGTDFYPLSHLGIPENLKTGTKLMGWLRIFYDRETPIDVTIRPDETEYHRLAVGGDDMYVHVRGTEDLRRMIYIEFDEGYCETFGVVGYLITCEDVYEHSSGSSF